MCIENDLSKVKEKINEIEEKSGDGGYIFRGERKTYKEDPYFGKVSSSLWREYRSKDLDIERVQQEILKSAKKHIGQLPNDYRPSRSRFNKIFLKDMNEAVDFEILTELQHYGGKTNLIDFSTDYLIALFFACDGHHDKEGRIIMQKTKEIEDIIWYPQNPRHRVVAQKSIFIRHPKGFIEPSEEETVTIPKDLKQPFLEYLQKYHDISTETIYNDLQGFIRNQNVHVNANIHFFRGFACQNRADEATTTEVKQQEHENAIKHYTESIKSKPDYTAAYNNRGIAYYHIGDYNRAIEDYDKAIEIQPDYVNAYHNRGTVYSIKGELDNAITDFDKAIELKPDYDKAYNGRGVVYTKKGDYNRAIEDYDKAIELKPDLAELYYNRGEALLHLNEMEKAKADLITAKEMGVDIVAAFRIDYESVADFEQKHNVKLPEDIVEMLTPS